MFPDTAGDTSNCSLSAYFNNARVQQQLARGESGVAPAAAAAVDALAAVAGGVHTQFGRAAAAVRAALAHAPETAAQQGRGAQRLLERQGDGGAGGDGSDAPRRQQRQQHQDWDADDRPAPEQWPPAGLPGGVEAAYDFAEGAHAGHPRDNSWADPLPRGIGGGGGWGAGGDISADEDERQAEGRTGAADAWMRRPGQLAGAGRQQEQLQQLQRQLPRQVVEVIGALQRALPRGVDPAGAAKLAAAAVGALALAACVLRGAPAPSGAHARSATPVAAATAAAALDAGSAARLVRSYQEARWQALGPDWDSSALPAVADGSALSHLRAQCDQYASRGWFQRFKLGGLRVSRVHPEGPGAARVEASLRESSSMFGVDGRRAESVASEYDVEYRVAAGADGRWRVTSSKVLGKEPGGGGLGGLFGR
ncbi:hypothetical protein MNEG_14042 [Monoraphidium neglectum]|uniref:Plastid division protein CDP1-like IMS domain-containing protein n=1 Tax=Monoraphidium neglectum TaxID=145388 RepID=A0A0D2LWI1_9CHLO|nr:hypothetical protein MNEG_14042 [Monoraphidium neglectum]KIY93921.1 hypothetical protein MNEG_14042 [Monoraphidium neglectum]|eukprot:XP_013892941.1 hypothetical protein MNEG_14042 [Monoraphidium neglectum]